MPSLYHRPSSVSMITSGWHCRGSMALHNPRGILRFEGWSLISLWQGRVLAVQTVQASLVAAIAAVALTASHLPASAGEPSNLALTISIEGAIGPATAGYVKDALAKAAERRAAVVVLRL